MSSTERKAPRAASDIRSPARRRSWVASHLRPLALAAAAVIGTAMLGGSTVSYYEEALPTTMNPLFARSMVDRRSHELVFDRLFYRSAITNELKSRLVSRFEVQEGGKKLKMWFVEGVKWHDGKPFGPADVCFTIEAMLNPATPSTIARDFKEALVGCTALPKENAAVVEFVKAYHNPRERVAFSVLPKHAFESTAIAPDAEFSTRPVGTGPMRGAKGRREVKFTAVPNAHHAARIQTLQQSEGGDPFVQIRTLLNAGVQGVVSVPPPHRPDIAASDDVALKSYDLRSWWFIALNTNSSVLKDRRIRQAINLSIDRSQLRELTIGVDPQDNNPPCEFVSGPFVQSSPYYNRSVKVIERSDKGKAAELMKAAGATQQAGRWIVNGQPVTLRIGMNGALDAEAKDLLNQIANQLQEAGFDRQVHKIGNDDWNTKAITGQLSNQFDALIGKWSFGVVEDVNSLFHTRKGVHGAQNIFNYSNAEVDKILARFEAARTDTEAQDAYHELHAYLAEDLPYVFLWKLDTKSAWRNEVRNNTITPYYYFTEFDGWRL